jgi:hypothetical protein
VRVAEFVSLEVSIMLKKFFCSLVLLLFAGTLRAQSDPQTTTPPAPSRPMRQENCFQQAGLQRSAVERIRTIGRDTRSQIEGVCSNSSLTPQQQNQQVREIRDKAMQERAGLMTADQQKAVTACQQAKHGYHPAASGARQGHLGGCGEMPRSGSRPGGALNGAPGNTAQPPSQPSTNQPSQQN